MTSQYKLVYFNCRYLGEPIRWTFAVAGVPFEDQRIEDDDWPNWKPKFNWGQTPVLYENGKETQMSQSAAICRYLARKYKLTGNDEFEAYLCDQYVDHIADWRSKFAPVYQEEDKVKRAEIVQDLMKEIFPTYLSKFNEIVKKSGGPYLLGGHFTWADFFLANFLEIFEELMTPVTLTLLDEYQELKNLKTAVFSIPQIKEFVEKRPKTEL